MIRYQLQTANSMLTISEIEKLKFLKKNELTRLKLIKTFRFN